MDDTEKIVYLPNPDIEISREMMLYKRGAEAARKQAILLFEKCMMTGKMFDLFAAEENKTYMGGVAAQDGKRRTG